MILLSPDRMKRYDEFAIGTWGIPSAVLMENAGRTTYRLMKRDYLKSGDRIALFCGRGNNGGDGFVIARYALRDGFDTEVSLLADLETLKGDARTNMELYRKLGGRITVIAGSPEDAVDAAKKCDIIVDAIFGTGLAKDVGGAEKKAIEAINVSGKRVVAVDIPSGLDGLRGTPLGVAVKATCTYTYGHPKIGHFLYPGIVYRGALTVVDISLPLSAQSEIGIDGYLVDGDMIRGLFRTRPAAAHKGDFGSIAVIAGSAGKTGAATMTTLAALKVGAGLVTLLTPASLNPIVGGKLTEAMTYPVDDGGRGYFTAPAFDAIRDFTADKDVIVVGPGLGQAEETKALVRRLYAEIDKPFVLDADGINAFDGKTDLLAVREKRAVLTPHPGEFGRLIGKSPKEVNSDRLELGRAFVKRHKVALVLKGAPTLIFSPDGDTYINPTGNPALAKGGTGDVLTGFVGGLMGQGYSMIDASTFAVYLHGYIADTWVDEQTDMDLLAGDLIAGLGKAIRAIRYGTDRVYVEESL